jgi:predicted transglutaminase-like cysteine proteinase
MVRFVAMEGKKVIKKISQIASLAAALHAGAPAAAQEKSKLDTRRTLVTTEASEKAPPFMRTYGEINPPQGFVELCERIASECERQNKSVSELMRRAEGNEVQMEELRAITSFVNKNVTPMSDKAKHGVNEHWEAAKIGGAGDCEDYALLKRKMLLDSGWQPSQLLMTVVMHPVDGGHAVLLVRTDKGDYILDNLNDEVMLWSDAVKKGYKFIMRQSSRDPRSWVSLRPPGTQ